MHDTHDTAPTLADLEQQFTGLTEAIREHATRHPGRNEPEDDVEREWWVGDRAAWSTKWARLWSEQP
ncbi:hypothetical protein [Embleya sp. AB8]|uniref:hypothetical protein n=1 Tax=Embleya sp. AB8 TaxID=3156304 RepID=UPI003C7800DB